MKLADCVRRVFWCKPVTFVVGLFLFRWLLLLELYFLKTPSGGNFVERPATWFLCASIANVSACAFLSALFSLTSIWRGKISFFLRLTFSFLAWFYLLLCAVDAFLMRWMGQHCSFAFFSTYSISRLDATLASNIVREDWLSFLLSFSILILAFAFFSFLNFFPGKNNAKLKAFAFSTPPSAYKTLPFILFLFLLGVISSVVCQTFKPCRIRLSIIQPPHVSLVKEYFYERAHRVKPAHFEAGISFLGGKKESTYPFYKPVENEDSLLEIFRKKPLEEKRDVIFLSLESFRGWSGDFSIESNCARMKNLCALSRVSTIFPYTYSVGYPSTEGMLGLQLGIWSHPSKTFLTSLMNEKTRSLPEILGKAGYERIVQTAAEPSFDNFKPWFEKWFDYVEYDPKITEDILLAQRFKEIYANAPKDKPLYYEWINFITHTPFRVPKSYGEPAQNSNERYAQALTYLDSALGIIFETVFSGERAKNTIIAITGDHSVANAKSEKRRSELGEAGSAYTWTTFIWFGEDIPKGARIETPISHTDYAPTVLSLLGIQATNHFVGKNLFETEEKENLHRTFSFRNAYAALRTDSYSLFVHADDSEFSHARKSHIDKLDPTNPIGTLIAEEKLEKDLEQKILSESADSLVSAMDAWAWILDNYLLAPENGF